MTAFLGWLVLGEALGTVEVVGLVLTVVGVAIVQLAPMLARPRIESPPTTTRERARKVPNSN
jgi:drug/metabolite transporter (DMT)-like permease